MSDEKIETAEQREEPEFSLEQVDADIEAAMSGEGDEDTENEKPSLIEDFKSTVNTPYRMASIWNSPLGLAASVYIAVKLIDLARDLGTKHIKAKEAELRRL